MNLQVILGPPGTGKTTTLIKECVRAIETGANPQRIGFLSFTRQAAEQAIQKAGAFSQRGLPYFRTIHSLAFRELNFSTGRVFSSKHLVDFAHQHGYDFTFGNVIGEDGSFIGRTEDDKVFHLLNLAKVSFIPIEVLYSDIQEVIPLDVDLGYILKLNRDFLEYKLTNSVFDFTDMIRLYAERNKFPKLDMLCIDEGQDLPPIQWEIVQKLMDMSDTVFIGGDDDQSIYEWSGADVKTFQAFAANFPSTVLNQTHRYGSSIQVVANEIIKRCKNRVPKDYLPAEKQSSVTRVTDLDFINSLEGTTLVLARNAYLLREVTGYLSEEFNSKDWSFVSDKKTKARIKIGTIHSAKGAEADNVVLLTDMSRTTYENINSDAETRVWYVACTRAKRNLFIVEPQTMHYYEV